MAWIKQDFFKRDDVQEYLASAWEYDQKFVEGYNNMPWWMPALWYRFHVSIKTLGNPPEYHWALDVFFTQKHWNPREVWICSKSRLWIGSWRLIKWKDDGKYHLVGYTDNWI